jgi:hypothetical protein
LKRNTQAPEKNPNSVANTTVPATFLTASMLRIRIPQAAIHGTMTVKTPKRWANMFGKMRPTTLAPFIIVIWKSFVIKENSSGILQFYHVECKSRGNTILDRHELQEKYSNVNPEDNQACPVGVS